LGLKEIFSTENKEGDVMGYKNPLKTTNKSPRLQNAELGTASKIREMHLEDIRP